ncbi:hypothetical protein ACFQX7_32910 [Luedemannella flava]|uniref:hypothetical protein n=1 Tax=Luedemannella flava TaxID=349316 RepID=UPI0031D27743
MDDGIRFDVDGWPPQKNEARSMFAANHRLADRVVALLRAAGTVLPTGWAPFAGPVGLDVVLRGPRRPPADATNYLGGIADVLQDKSRTLIDLTHLGDLADVAVFVNDCQISRISYREEPANHPSYEVRIFPA